MAEPTTSTAKQTSRNAREILQEERYLWMARAFVVMLVLAIICDIVLLIALANVTPVLRVQPFYLEIQNKDQQTISVIAPKPETLNSDTLKESLVRQYVLSRYGVGSDLAELEQRWGLDGPVYWLSDQLVYDEFTAKEADKLRPLAHRDSFVRNARILNVKKTQSGGPYGPDEWAVDVEFSDTNRASTSEVKSVFHINMATAFRPTRKGLSWADRLKNPLGFVVLDFGISGDNQKSKK